MENNSSLARVNTENLNKDQALALLLALQSPDFVQKATELAQQMGFAQKVAEMGADKAEKSVKMEFSEHDYPDLIFFGSANKDDVAYELGDDVSSDAITSEVMARVQQCVDKVLDYSHVYSDVMSEAISMLDNETVEKVRLAA